MAAPKVSYFDEAGVNPVTQWQIGEIDAGTTSNHLKVTVWNNKGGSEAVSHMKNVRVTTVNENGGETGGQGDVVVRDAWVNVKVNGAEQAVKIGGAANQAQVNAAGVDAQKDGYIIKGDANDGTKANSAANYAGLEFFVEVPPNADEGKKPFRIRTGYSYT